MAMTMPVEITPPTNASSAAAAAAGSMAFVLPSEFAGDAAPAPLPSADVSIERVPARLVAALPFAGVVTDEEVARQTDALRAALEADGSVAAVDERTSVLQYNSPLTLPWRRRNEVAIVVREALDVEPDATGVVSWYDAGERLR